MLRQPIIVSFVLVVGSLVAWPFAAADDEPKVDPLKPRVEPTAFAVRRRPDEKHFPRNKQQSENGSMSSSGDCAGQQLIRVDVQPCSRMTRASRCSTRSWGHGTGCISPDREAILVEIGNGRMLAGSLGAPRQGDLVLVHGTELTTPEVRWTSASRAARRRSGRWSWRWTKRAAAGGIYFHVSGR